MRPVPKCPLRLGESCTLCNPGASGPEDCPSVYAVMTDPDLRARLAALRAEEGVVSRRAQSALLNHR